MVEHALREVAVDDAGFTVEQWLAFDGPGDLRVELIDGALVVNPAPVPRHNRVAQRLLRLIDDAMSPAGLTTDLTASGVISPGMQPEQAPIPDILLVRADLDIDDIKVVQAADVALVVEVLSSSSRHADQVRKRELYAGMGIPHYWIVDPTSPVTITTFGIEDGTYRRRASASGDEELSVDEPLRLTLTPAALVKGRKS